jgi:hypothetical protein
MARFTGLTAKGVKMGPVHLILLLTKISLDYQPQNYGIER